jgi:hypothetical protein
MNTQKVIAGFFIILAMTLNFGFFYGDIDNFSHHSPYELFATIVVNLIATILKLGDKTQLGSVLLATSLVADIQLLSASIVWGLSSYVATNGIADSAQIIVSLSGGALMANIVSVILFMGDTLKSKR